MKPRIGIMQFICVVETISASTQIKDYFCPFESRILPIQIFYLLYALVEFKRLLFNLIEPVFKIVIQPKIVLAVSKSLTSKRMMMMMDIKMVCETIMYTQSILTPFRGLGHQG